MRLITSSSKWGILRGLAIHFFFWWAVSAWFWTSGFGRTRWSWLAPLSPIYLGIFYLQRHGDWQWGVVGVIAAAGFIVLVILAARTKRRLALLLAHASILTYWLVGFSLIATGV